MAFWTQLGLLIWKNLQLYRRSYIPTFLSFALPITFALVMLKLRNLNVMPKNVTATLYLSRPVYVTIYRMPDLPKMLYVPDAPIVKQVMVRVLNRIKQMNRRMPYPITLNGLENEEKLEKYYADDNSDLPWIAVVFKGVEPGATTLPDHAYFTIRPKYVFLDPDGYSSIPFKKDFSWAANPPDAATEFRLQGWLTLQGLIGESLVSTWSGKDVFFDLNARVISFPAYIKDFNLKALEEQMSFFFVLSFAVPVFQTTKVVIHEKETKLKEAMKLTGLVPSAYWISWFLTAYAQLALTMWIFAYILGEKIDETALLRDIDVSFLFAYLLCYAAAILSFAMMMSVFFKHANTGAAVSGGLYFLSFAPYRFIRDSYNYNLKMASALLFNTAVSLGVRGMSWIYHKGGGGVDWTNYSEPVYPDTISVQDCMLMLVVDTFLHFFIMWYVDEVSPGEFGTPKPFYFFLTKNYWCGSDARTVVDDGREVTGKGTDASQDPRLFEEEPENLRPGIRACHLRKVYGDGKVAVHDLTVNMYEGHITVLLGHNGAGKTSTMLMLTGFSPITSGAAYIDGYNIRTDLDKLKGCPNDRVKEEVDTMLNQTGLEAKRYAQAYTLSGGQKRRLSIAIALIHGSKVVILDEPTSGVDPSSRRQIWDLLQRNRPGRTLMLSTHFMDEADALGNRIGIMSEGNLVCCGTPLFLKQLCGSGYHLAVVTLPSCDVDNLGEFIRAHIQGAKFNRQHKEEVMYLLPDDEILNFPMLFRNLDCHKEELGIRTFGASATTMEDVFLKMGTMEAAGTLVGGQGQGQDDDTEETQTSSVSPHAAKSNLSSSVEPEEEQPPKQETRSKTRKTDAPKRDRRAAATYRVPKYERLTGLSLLASRVRAIAVKKSLDLKRKIVVATGQMLLPVAFTLLMLNIPSPKRVYKGDPIVLQLDQFDDPIVTYMVKGKSAEAASIGNYYSKLFPESVTVRELKLADGDMAKQYTKIVPRINVNYIIGAEIHDAPPPRVKATVFYNGMTFNAQPIALNYLMDAIARHLSSGRNNITSAFKPFPQKTGPNVTDPFSRRRRGAFGWTFNKADLAGRYIGLGMSFMVTLFIYPLIKEQAVGAKLMQVLSGVGRVMFWVTNFVFDYLVYTFPALLVLAAFVVYDEPAFAQDGNLEVVTLVLIAYGWAMLPTLYLFHFFFTSAAAGTTAVLVYNIVTGTMISFATEAMQDLVFATMLDLPSTNDPIGARQTVDTVTLWFNRVDTFCFILMPSYSFARALKVMAENHGRKRSCQIFSNDCRLMMGSCCGMCTEDYCFAYNMTDNALGWSLPGAGRYVSLMFVQGLVFSLLTILLETNFAHLVLDFLSCTNAGTASDASGPSEDSDVAAERERISNTPIEELVKLDSLILINLSKQFGTFAAVKRVCVGVAEQECFGLLGQNGAGKTTIFKMLTGDIRATDGNAYLKGYDIKNHIHTVQRNIGYCPQFDAILDNMTGRETLIMYARLRGVPEVAIPDMASRLIDFLTLTPHADKLAGSYSGGNKRKLSTAMALVGDPHFVLLDEPSSGMDPGAMRMLWGILTQVRASGKTLLLTSHSMEECEALCTRIAIMVNSRFVCLGSTQHLKSKFGQGYTLIAKMASDCEGKSLDSGPLVDMVEHAWPSAYIFDVHEGYIHLQIPDKSVQLADVFGLMELAKQTLSVQYYIVQQTTLEQVFLSFARKQIKPATPLSAWGRCCNALCCFLASSTRVEATDEETTALRISRLSTSRASGSNRFLEEEEAGNFKERADFYELVI